MKHNNTLKELLKKIVDQDHKTEESEDESDNESESRGSSTGSMGMKLKPLPKKKTKISLLQTNNLIYLLNINVICDIIVSYLNKATDNENI